MSDNNIEISERRLQEIGNQLGTPILSPTTHIQVDDESVPSSSQSNADIEGTFDSQPSSKNPLLQYIVAGAIGLGAVGIPLTVLFGLGGTPQTATKPTAPEVEDTTSSTSDRELDNLKTQSALDIQAKSEPQTVAQTPKPATTPVARPTTTVAAPQPKPKPVVQAPAPQPKTIAVPPPTVVAATPATVARPVPIPVTRPIARIVPKPTPAPVIQSQRSTPIAVATQPATPTQPTQSVTPEQPPLSFEQASALGMFGGDNDKPDDGSLAVANGDTSTLTLTLPVGANVAAHTVTPYTSLSSRNIATNGTETPLSVQLDQPIQLSQGFNLPAGTIVQFGATVADNGAVTATSKGVFIDGTEIKVPVGAFALTASNSAALVASQRSLREGELSGADIDAAMWGAAGSVGKALVDSGTTSVVNTSGLGTSVVQTNNGNVNIPGAVLQGAFSPLAKAKADRANALAQELQQSSKLNEIPVRSPVRVFVAAAATVQVPVGSDINAAAAATPEQGRVLGGGEVDPSPTMIPAKPISANNVQPVVAPPPTRANTQPIVAPAPVTARSLPAFTPQLPITQTTQPTQGINTPSPIAPTKPNNAVNTRSTIVVPQSVTTPTQPIVTAPSLTTTSQPAAITQPSVVPQVSNGVIVQPTTVPTTIDRSAIIQPAFTPQQPIQQPSITTSDRLPPVGSPTTFIPSQPIPSTTQTAPTPTQTIVIQQQPSTATTQPASLPSQPTGATTITTPIAPTKPNNIINTQQRSSAPIQSNSGIDAQSPPIITSTQPIDAQNTQDPAPITTQPTTIETSSRLIPIQVDRGGNIHPATIP